MRRRVIEQLAGRRETNPLKRSPLLQSPGRQRDLDCGPDEFSALEPQRVERLSLHFRIGLRRPPRQGRRPDLRRDPRRDLRAGPARRVAAETLCNTGLVVLAGEITTNAHVDYIQVARDTIKRIGYDNTDYGIDYKGCAVLVGLRQAEQRHRPGRGPRQRRPPQHRRRRPGPDVRLRLRRDARADARADLLRAPPGRAPGAAAQGRPPAVPAARREEPGDDALRRRQAALDRHRGAVEPARPEPERDADEDEGLVHRGGDRGDHQAGAAEGVAEGNALPGQPDRSLRHRRPAGRLRPDRPQDHRRHLRRRLPARRRRVLRARIRRRSTARPPTRRATSPRTSSPPASRASARSRWPTPSASPSR